MSKAIRGHGFRWQHGGFDGFGVHVSCACGWYSDVKNPSTRQAERLFEAHKAAVRGKGPERCPTCGQVIPPTSSGDSAG